MKIIKYNLGDVIELRKKHPCGSDKFKILRVGGIMRICCLGCGRDMEIDRLKLEKSTKKIFVTEETQ